MARKVTSQRHVLAELDHSAGRRVGRAKAAYDDGVLAPVRNALESASSPEAALAALGGSLLQRLDAGVIADELEGAITQAALVGRTSANPERAEQEE